MIAKAHEPDPRERERGKLWALLLEWHENDVLLHHPDYDSGGESHITHMPPFIGISTTAYEDVDQILQRVYQECCVQRREQRAVLLSGDHQTFQGM